VIHAALGMTTDLRQQRSLVAERPAQLERFLSELEIEHEPAVDSVEAMIERITLFGFDARVELSAAEGDALTVQLTRERLELLELDEGQIVWVRAARERTFA